MSTVARMVKSSSKLTLIAANLLLASCGSVEIHSPSATFMTAETAGRSLGGSFLVTGQSGTNATFDAGNAGTSDPLELKRIEVPLGIALDLGIVSRFDFYNRNLLYHDSPGIYGVKYQILGTPRAQAGEGNHALAVALGRGTESDTDEDIFPSGDAFGTNLRAESDQAISELMLIYSYRLEKHVAVYTNLKYNKHEVNAKIISSSDSSQIGKRFELESDIYGTSLGLMGYFGSLQVAIEASLQQTNWSNNDRITYGFLTGALGWNW